MKNVKIQNAIKNNRRDFMIQEQAEFLVMMLKAGDTKEFENQISSHLKSFPFLTALLNKKLSYTLVERICKLYKQNTLKS